MKFFLRLQKLITMLQPEIQSCTSEYELLYSLVHFLLIYEQNSYVDR